MLGFRHLNDIAPPSAPAGTRLYAVGDIHGRLDLLDEVLHAIKRDAESSSAERKIVVFLGDLIDRGPDSRAVIQKIIDGPSADWRGFCWLALRGNHEDILLRFLDDPSYGPNWFANGGLATIESYIGSQPGQRDPFLLQAALRQALPIGHRRFLEEAPFSHREGGYMFVHAGVRPGVDLDAQAPEDLMWIRNEFLNSAADHGSMIVHGHTITDVPQDVSNRIGIDTGAYASGRLTALAAEGDRHWFLSTGAGNIDSAYIL